MDNGVAHLRDLLKRASALQSLSPRLRDSVVAPLSRSLGSGPNGAAQASASSQGDLQKHLRDLARDATALRSEAGAPPALLEATAALQRLALDGEVEGSEERTALADALSRLQEGLPPSIEPAPDGPLLVTNVEDLRNWLGEPIPTTPQMALCRCGASAIKPFCDGSHASSGFTDAKDPKRVPDRRDTYVGQQLTVLDNRGTCQHSGFCTDRLRTVFRLDEEPFVAPSGGRMDEIVRAVRDCPSGALSYAIDGVEAREEVDLHGRREPAIEVTKDGPYRVTGAISLIDESGADVPRNEGASREHYALCRCGHAQNKPFCTGMHWYVDFRDPTPDPGHAPTIFEWAGGLPALTRMERLFYEKYIPQDPVLAPVFAHMPPDHPHRVAKWLAEVFGGPPFYSEEYGGYERMLSQHIGKGITEEWRARWVSLLLRAASEAGLPNDPEFRSAFQSYIEWGSRLAVENSQAESRPPPHMPMPHWDWTTAAGPPGSRISALAPQGGSDDKDEVVVDLPAPGEEVRFGEHIKPLFRERDRKSMLFAFDLWSHSDASTHADAILERLRNGTMPCDGAWPPERVAVFERWVDAGKPE
jgi:CDGSH-type Zn-finger protein/truncated hemoglobin YjbI